MNQIIKLANEVIRLEETKNPRIRKLVFEIRFPTETITRDRLFNKLSEQLQAEFLKGWAAAEEKLNDRIPD